MVALSGSPDSFAKAKRIASQIFRVNPMTLYCQCTYDEQGTIDLSSCGMNKAQSKQRAHPVEWEQMLAVEHFGKQFPCWRENLVLTLKANLIMNV